MEGIDVSADLRVNLTSCVWKDPLSVELLTHTVNPETYQVLDSDAW